MSKVSAVFAVAMWLALLSSSHAAASDHDWLDHAFAPKRATSAAPSKPLGQNGARRKVDENLSGAAQRGAVPGKPKSLVGNHIAPAGQSRWQWKITKLKWTSTDEEAYGAFIRRIGESKCKTTHECLTSPDANPAYYATNPPGMQFFADCADLPYVLRAYFAWKNGLPFSFSSALAAHPRVGHGGPVVNAFQVVGRYHIVPPGPEPRQVLTEILRVSTSHFRVPSNYKGHMLPDHYPVDITRESVKAGTVIFDALGHVTMVYKVGDDGVVHYIEAHPDNSLTRSVFGSDIERSGPESGAGFLRWRPQMLVGARKAKDGKLQGGLLLLTRNAQLPDWSDAQYFGSGPDRPKDWKLARFQIEGEEIDYYAYVRLRLAAQGYRFDPVVEVRNRIRTLCEELRQRVDAVDAAVRAGMNRRPQPDRLPRNIYVTQGEWEAFATPARDAQLKALFISLREDIKRFIAMHGAGSRHLSYDGTDLRVDLKDVYESEVGNCSITYQRTDGSAQTLTFSEIRKRLFLLSFDPYHCIERRWGATSPAELSTCQDNDLKKAWYDAEQRLRNQTVRTIGDRMDFTLEDLHRQARESSDDVGDDEPPVIEVASLLGGD